MAGEGELLILENSFYTLKTFCVQGDTMKQQEE